MEFKAGDRVMVEYVATLDDGTVVDSTEKEGPVILELGVQKIMIGFEDGLRGMKIDEEREIVIEPEVGFGQPDPALIMDLPRDGIPEEGHSIGKTIRVQLDNDMAVQGIVLEVGDDTLKIDFNHPLRGKRLTYSVKVLEFLPGPEISDQADIDPE